jgi:hypothetical protein
MELSSADSLDVKSSLVLILVTFIGTELLPLLATTNLHGKCVPELCLIFVVFSLVSAAISMWPREYSYPDPDRVSDRVEELKNIYYLERGSKPDQDIFVSSALRLDQIEWNQARLQENKRVNLTKARWLNCAFYCACVGLALFIWIIVKPVV